MMTVTRQQAGFTLIEIAVVMVIIGILLGSFITTFNDRIDNTRIEETEHDLDEIKSVLMAYAYTRGGAPHLPCPDTSSTPDGQEDRNGTTGKCSGGYFGVLPWKTLGLGYGDAWGTLYSYWVDNDYADGPPDYPGIELSTTIAGANVNTRINDTLKALTNNAVAVVFSHGKNSLGGIDTSLNNRPSLPALGNGYDDENENQDGDLDFITRYRTEEGVTTAGGIFDDILVWIGPYELKAKMVETGVLP